ncbi:MAG: 3-phosphoshikimate 1-carboxyvinyltransferase [Coriobacteriia bacterium]|nr:3-phosphoshikimate 1-carboxyvinyltransferase [Coriobacteriia bacterium]
MSTNLTTIEPLGAPLTGTMRVPGDKSISHRSVLFGAMAEGTSHLTGVLDSADVRSSLGAVAAMGAQVNLEKQPDGSLAGTITGWGESGPRQPEEPLDCGNSGTTTRLLMGLLAPWDIQATLQGDESLSRRPMRRITGPLSQMGARFTPDGQETLPLTVHGTCELQPLRYEMPVASAQLKTAVLLAGIFAQGTTWVQEPAPSRDHTELMLPAFGVAVERPAACQAQVTGPQRLHAADVDVPGDPSSAAFPACAAVLAPGSSIRIENVSLNAARIGFAQVLKAMDAQISWKQTGAAGEEPIGTISVAHTADLKATTVEPQAIAGMVDEIPVLSLVAAHASGVTRFKGAGELRVKETDRFQAVIDGLAVLGVRAWAEGDDLCIEGQPDLQPQPGLTFDSLDDHRLAMTWSLVGLTGTEPVQVARFDAIRISYPTFLDDIRSLA